MELGGDAGRKIGILVAAILLVGLAYLALVPPPTATPENEELYSALQSAGIEDALVDVTDDRVLVRYERPEGYDVRATNYLVMGAAVEAAPYTERVVVESYDGSTRLERISANTGDVLAIVRTDDPSPEDWERLQATMEVEE